MQFTECDMDDFAPVTTEEFANFNQYQSSALGGGP